MGSRTKGRKLKRIKLDAKRRVTLGKLISDETTSFDIELTTNGRLILTPVRTIEVSAGEAVVTVPEEEAWLFRNKEAFESVKRGLEQSANGQTSLNAIDFEEDVD